VQDLCSNFEKECFFFERILKMNVGMWETNI